MAQENSRGGDPLPEDHRRRIRSLIDEHGEVGAGELLGISRQALARAVGGLGVRAGTAALVREALAKLDEAAR